jgi:Aspartic acid proteinase inhibitor
MRLQMKKSLRILIAVAALGTVLGYAPGAFSQRMPMAGGYSKTSTGSQEVVDAARFAIREHEPGGFIFIDSIKSAEVQVVAGLNYRLVIRVWDSGKLRDVKAVVYKNLKRKYSLTSWEEVGNAADSSSSWPSLYADSPIEQLMKAIDEAYMARALGRLDARRPYLGRVRIVISHSLAEEGSKDEFEIRTFRTLAQAERWLRSREIGDEKLPRRETRPLYDCQKGTCEYDFNGGILHNTLYLQSVDYVIRGGRVYIKTINLMDGD